ncbi:MAG: hypothetical protein SW833_00775 [Cyanobacteriota bacterium]|nr:hypothetical protein [Cyanobacteriota bacterium]
MERFANIYGLSSLILARDRSYRWQRASSSQSGLPSSEIEGVVAIASQL